MAIPLMMQWLIGTWFIVSSDAPVWLKGDRTLPATTYTLVDKKGVYKLLDETKFVKNGKHKIIAGYDYGKCDNDSSFLWRGNGALFFVTSKWRVCIQDKAGQWAVIAYSKTLFTPEGVDIISRKAYLDPATIREIQGRMCQDKELCMHVAKMKNIAQK